MPCRCCGASRPSKGFTEPEEIKIHALLKQAIQLVLEKNRNQDYEHIDDWKKAWQECFDHMLNGCKENTSYKLDTPSLIEKDMKNE